MSEADEQTALDGDLAADPWLPTILAALDLGITDLQHICAAIEAANAEDLRADLMQLAGRLLENAFQFQAVLASVRRNVRTAEAIATQHAGVQYELLQRMETLAKTADVDQIAKLTDAYTSLPRPCADCLAPVTAPDK